MRDAFRKRSGFSLAEIIAVLAIMAILAAAVVGVGRYAAKKARVGKADATLEKIRLAVELYRQDFDMYPPDSKDTKNGESLASALARLNWRAGFRDALGREGRSRPSDSNYDKPSEILFFFLEEMYDVMNFDPGSRQANKRVLARLPRTKAYVKFKRNELADTDHDGLPEIVDGWGMPFLYVARDWLAGDSPAVNIEPHKGKNPESFSLYSFGPDKLGYYDPNPGERMERVYPVGDLDFDGDMDGADDSEMIKRINRFAQGEGYSSGAAKGAANRDNLTNWERGR
jgi:prepilin-type N-terminal cleavage/methylation domain-containing protein